MTDSKTMLFRITIALLVIALIFFGLKTSGFHIQGLSIVKGGSIAVLDLPEDIDLFIDNSKVTVDSELGIIDNIAPGVHSIIVSQNGYWPWVKQNLEVLPNKATTIAPFLVSKNVSGLIITREDPEYWSLRNSVETEVLPTRAEPITSADTEVSAFVEEGKLITIKGDDEVTVLESESVIRNIAFYKDRSDVILMASQDGVFAIETDMRFLPQNFQPIYKGTASPKFTKDETNTVYVLDGELLFLVNL